jgi:hypothetical protein
MIAVGLAVDDVDGSGEDDVERRVALSLLERTSPGENDRVSARSAICMIWAAVRRGNRVASSGSRKPSTGVGELYWLIIKRCRLG